MDEGDRESRCRLTPNGDDDVMEGGVGRKPLHLLDLVKMTMMNIEQKEASLNRMKHKEVMRKAKLQELRAGDHEDKVRSSELAKTEAELQKREGKLQKRKEELEVMFKAIEKEKGEIVQRQKSRDAEAAALQAECDADERLKLLKEKELWKDKDEARTALLLLQAASK